MMNQEIENVIPAEMVPPELCFSCDVCCRFPEKNSFLAPYFTAEERVAVSGEGEGEKITLIQYKEGYICPAFDPSTSHCLIYDLRPLDCQLYPFAVMWDASGREIVLGMDTKCPYVREQEGAECMMRSAEEIASAIESPRLLKIFAENKQLIGPYQDDVIPLMTLKKITDYHQSSI